MATTTTGTTPARRARWRFFLEHAGYAVPPGRAACALEMARAEELLESAVDAGRAAIHWESDDFPYDAGDAATPAEARALFESGAWTGPYFCRLEVGGETVAGLSGIVVGPEELRDPYCRVVAAELAGEALEALRPPAGRPVRRLRGMWGVAAAAE